MKKIIIFILIFVLSTSVFSKQLAFRIYEGTSTINISEAGYFIPDEIYWDLKTGYQISQLYKKKYENLEDYCLSRTEFKVSDYFLGIGTGLLAVWLAGQVIK